MLLALGCWGVENLARVMPGIVRNLARPCAGCYLGAFVPPLEPFIIPANRSEATGRVEAIAPAQTTVRTAAIDAISTRPDSSGHWLGPGDPIAAQQTSLFGFNCTNPGVIVSFVRNDADMMCQCYASAGRWTFTRFEPDLVGDRPRNDNKMARAMWTGVPIDRFADNRLNVASLSEAGTLADTRAVPAFISPEVPWYGSHQTQISDDRIWNHGVQHAAGLARTTVTPSAQGSVPYWRVAVQQDLQRHFPQVGPYWTNAGLDPGVNLSARTTEPFMDLRPEAHYQFVVAQTVSDFVSAQSILLQQTGSPAAGSWANGIATVDTFRAGLLWDMSDNIVTSIQYFRHAGAIEAMPYLWPGARPDNAGVTAWVSYVPWKSAGLPIQFLDLRIAAQYVAYTEFNGNGRGVGANDGLSLSLWGALHF